jgi:hypothetical protein
MQPNNIDKSLGNVNKILEKNFLARILTGAKNKKRQTATAFIQTNNRYPKDNETRFCFVKTRGYRKSKCTRGYPQK